MFPNYGNIAFPEKKTPKRMPFYESPSTGSIGTSILAASWLENCLANHPGCKHQRAECHRPPSRLIDVGDANGARVPHLCSPGTTSVPYITLSHRWGTGEQMMLTKASLSDMSKSIDLADLSQTYKDAILITRLLGLRYLWIGSLCIIQDSINDWQTEAAKMGDIYKFSFCTIAASWASSRSEGCFFDRGPLHAEFNLSQVAKPMPRLLGKVHRRKGLRSNTEYQAEPNSKKTKLTTFDCVLKRRRSRLSTEIAGFNHNLNHSSLKYLTCRAASTMSLTIDAESVGKEGFGTIAQKSNVQSKSISKRKIGHPGNIQSISNGWDALESSAKSSNNLESERCSPTANPAVEPTSSGSARRESAILYIIPFQRDLWAQSVYLSPLSRRAWALQERLLSPRTLHYTKMQLFWECRESKASESSPQPWPKKPRGPFDLPTYSENTPAALSAYLESTHELYGLDVEPLHRHWPEIIEKYTDTLMTKLEDKLVAISGLARQVYSITKDQYCAGIWREDLVTQLLWRLQRPQ